MSNKQPLDIFREITTIPRASGDEEKISEYLMAFARERGLSAERDGVNNVIIRKPGAKGREKAPTLVLQSHMDMVYVKKEGCAHAYNSPLELVEKDGFLSANGTSLGADDGIGMAYALALLDSDAPHPPLEALFTAGEETGMEGVIGLSPTALKGRRMINLDSTDEGTFIAGCAGGIRPTFTRKAGWEAVPPGYGAFKLTISGLLGGHSGQEIQKGRGNAIRLLGRTLHAAVSSGARVGRLCGGSKTNVIPDHAEAIVLTKDERALQAIVAECSAAFKNELAASDAGVRVSLQTCDYAGKALDGETLRDVLTLIMGVPLNVQTMNAQLGLVESSNNIGILTCSDEAVTLACGVRSSVATLKRHICDQMTLIAQAARSEVRFDGDYPEWAFAQDSPLREKAVEAYMCKFGVKPQVLAIHAGLECGFFKAHYPDMDMISIGPSVFDIHSPAEKLDIASAERVYAWLVELCGVV